MTKQPACAHLSVAYKTTEVGNTVTAAWWACVECGKRFVPEVKREYVYEYPEGTEKPIEDSIILRLLELDELIVFFDHPYLSSDDNRNRKEDHTVALMVNCSDHFAWGCADSEPIPDEYALLELWKLVEANPRWGAMQWCSKRRNQRPQKPVEKRMRETGGWSDLMESLPMNRMDRDLWGKPADGGVNA